MAMNERQVGLAHLPRPLDDFFESVGQHDFRGMITVEVNFHSNQPGYIAETAAISKLHEICHPNQQVSTRNNLVLLLRVVAFLRASRAGKPSAAQTNIVPSLVHRCLAVSKIALRFHVPLGRQFRLRRKYRLQWAPLLLRSIFIRSLAVQASRGARACAVLVRKLKWLNGEYLEGTAPHAQIWA